MSTYVEPINNPVDRTYSYLLHFHCRECKQRSILFFRGVGNYECQHCHKIFYIEKKKTNN